MTDPTQPSVHRAVHISTDIALAYLELIHDETRRDAPDCAGRVRVLVNAAMGHIRLREVMRDDG